jgi:predicted permease
LISPNDDRAGAPSVAVMSYAYWRSQYNGDPSVVGRAIEVNDAPFTVIGVAAPEFFGESVQTEDFWFPLVAQPQITRQPSMIVDSSYYWLNAMGRLKPGVTLAKARAIENAQLMQMLQTDAGGHPSKSEKRALADSHFEIAPGARGLSMLRTKYSEPLHMLIAIAGLVLLIVCANVANLQLSRGAAREKEVSVRLAVGASRGRLVRQFLTESVLLSAIGGLLGVLLARWGAKTLFVLVISGTGYPVQFSENGRVLGLALVVSLAVGILFGLVPAIGASGQNLATAMKGDSSTPGRSVPGFGGANAFVIMQIAAAVPLLIGTGLLARSFSKLMSQELGFHEEHILLAHIDTQTAGYTTDQLPTLYQTLLDRISAVPGVRAATLDSTTPLSGSAHTSNVSFEGQAPEADGSPEMMAHIVDYVGARYFETLGIPILQGRDISAEDVQENRRVGVINETFARTYLAGTNSVGMKYCLGSPCTADQAYEIVGIAADARYYSLRAAVPPTAFNTNTEGAKDFGRVRYIVIRAAGGPTTLEAEVVQTIAATADQLPQASVTTLRDQVLGSLKQDRVSTELAGTFGGVALLVACIGLYGTMSYRVARRTREIGIRMALGAQRSSVMMLVMKECSVLVAAGLLIGIPLALSLTWIIGSQLFGVSRMDPVTIALAAAGLCVVAAVAGAIPARRATRVDPMVALRYE